MEVEDITLANKNMMSASHSASQEATCGMTKGPHYKVLSRVHCNGSNDER